MIATARIFDNIDRRALRGSAMVGVVPRPDRAGGVLTVEAGAFVIAAAVVFAQGEETRRRTLKSALP